MDSYTWVKITLEIYFMLYLNSTPHAGLAANLQSVRLGLSISSWTTNICGPTLDQILNVFIGHDLTGLRKWFDEDSDCSGSLGAGLRRGLSARGSVDVTWFALAAASTAIHYHEECYPLTLDALMIYESSL